MPRGISQRAKRRREHLTLGEIEHLLEASKTASRNPVRDYCMLLMAFRHGLRVSELVSLRLKDIDLKAKEFYVWRVKDCDESVHPFFNGESAAIAKWLVVREAMQVPAEVDTLFVSERRRPMSRVTFHLMVRLIAEAAGLGHLEVHPHMLRHACGYALINKGTGIRTIQAYLGHRFISSTVRYTKLDKNRFKGLFC